MEKLIKFSGVVFPLEMSNVDTDQLIPKQFLKRVERDGYEKFLFYEWRFLSDGTPNPDFALNHERYKNATILLGRENFGSGSSREHAPWALWDYGFRVLIAPSYADIFRNNCFKNGLLLIQLEASLVDEWFSRALAREGYSIALDLPGQVLTGSDGFACSFDIDPFRKKCLLEGLDEISLTLAEEEAIKKYENSHAGDWQAAVNGRQAGRGLTCAGCKA